MIIAIDGHSSCGKSTVARQVAEYLHFRYIDTGAMYRAVTLWFLDNMGAVPGPEEWAADEEKFLKALDSIEITFQHNAAIGRSETWLNGVNIEKEIRQMRVSEQVSKISKVKSVRRKLVRLQQEMGREGNIVMDGRDIGTVVFPSADIKIFMTANSEIRAQRRFSELRQAGVDADFNEVMNNLVERDRIDSTRKLDPLRKAEDAVLLDNSNLNFQEQLDFVLDLVEKLQPRA